MFRNVTAIIAAAVLLITIQSSVAAAGVPDADSAVLPMLEAETAIMIDADTGYVLYDKNADQAMYPASATKMMTALLLLEYIEGRAGEGELNTIDSPVFDARLTMSTYAVYSIEIGSSGIGMDVGETLSLREALYAMMLPSANEVSCAVSEYVGGDEDTFADMMTARAAELGCPNSHFKNGHGLHDAEHYTTAKGLALILREAVKHPAFVEVISTRQYIIPPTEKQEESRYLNNTNELIKQGQYYAPSVIGGKTGYTDEARHTLAVYAERGDIRLITAVMGSTKGGKYDDTINLLNYGFDDYKTYTSENFLSGVLFDHTSDGAFFTMKLGFDGAFSFLIPNAVDEDGVVFSAVADGYDAQTVKTAFETGEQVGNLVFTDSASGVALAAFPLFADSYEAPPTPEPTAAPEKEKNAQTGKSVKTTANDDGADNSIPVAALDSGEPAQGSRVWLYVGMGASVIAAALLCAVGVNVFLFRRKPRYK